MSSMPEHVAGTADVPPRSRRAAVVLAAAAAAFLLLRVPVMYRQPGGMDEDWFAVPGWTVAQEGIPRVPYAPERNRESVFYKADETLFALPPAYHYWQAPFFLALPAGYGTARLASAFAGLLGMWLVFELGRWILTDETAALWAAVVYSLSRVFYFPATTARPDMLCGMLGLAAVCCLWQWSRRPSVRRLAAAGVCLGLGLLSHPFAIVYCLQAGVWVLWRSQPWRRAIRDAVLLTGTTVGVLLLWLPLILVHFDAFREQFLGNVLDRSGPGLLSRLVFPWPYATYHAGLLLEHAGAWQTALMAAGLLFAVTASRSSPNLRTLSILAISAVYLLVACQGQHPTKGYWCYPGALLCLCVGQMISCTASAIRRYSPRLSPLPGAVALALLVPGCGIRTTLAHVHHWNDVNYNAPRFVRSVLTDVPRGSRLIVDPAYVFDAWLAGHDAVLGVNVPIYFHADQFPYDYLIVGRYGLVNDLPRRLAGQFAASYGDKADPFACYVELYRPGGSVRDNDE